MNTYWDLTDKERACLTEEQVRSFCDVELMQKGVLKPIAPPMMDNPAGKPLQMVEMYAVGDLLFETLESAMACLDLKPFKSEYDSSVGWDIKFPVLMTDQPKRQALSDRAEVMIRKSELSEYRARKEEIQRAKTAYDEQCKASKDACSGVWDDYYEQRAKQGQYQRVVDTFAEYKTLAGGDKAIAMQFLEKAFDGATIKAALAWFDLD